MFVHILVVQARLVIRLPGKHSNTCAWRAWGGLVASELSELTGCAARSRSFCAMAARPAAPVRDTSTGHARSRELRHLQVRGEQIERRAVHKQRQGVEAIEHPIACGFKDGALFHTKARTGRRAKRQSRQPTRPRRGARDGHVGNYRRRELGHASSHVSPL